MHTAEVGAGDVNARPTQEKKSWKLNGGIYSSSPSLLPGVGRSEEDSVTVPSQVLQLWLRKLTG